MVAMASAARRSRGCAVRAEVNSETRKVERMNMTTQLA
jgi:hypothetical protein